MFRTDDQTLMALVLSGIAVLFVAVSTWWLYLSPMGAKHEKATAPSRTLAGWIALFLGISAAQLVIGALWDASMHIQTGRIPAGADFLWPPHIMIYSSFLISLIVTGIAIAIVALPAWSAGIRDPRQWVRQNPYLGAVAIASGYSLLSVPGDALWHELFGVDLTAWSPPHVMLAVMGSAVTVSAVGLLLQMQHGARSFERRHLAAMVLLGLALNVVYIIGVLEWELPGRTPEVAARPIWYYPLVGGVMAFFVLILAKRAIPVRWAATGTAIAFYIFRLGITFGLGATGNIAPALPLLFILGAILIDVIPWARIRSLAMRDITAAVAFTAGYAALAFPLLAIRSDLREFSGLDFVTAGLATLAVSVILFPIGQMAAQRLAGEQGQV